MRLCLFILILFAASGSSFGQHQNELAEQKLRDLYGTAVPMQTKILPVSDSLQSIVGHLTGVPCSATSVTVHYIIPTDGRRLYAIVDNVFGKEQFITYMVVFDDSERIRALEILVYREAYGGEITYRSFRKQFEDKQYKDDLRIGGAIRNITGATISSHAVTAGVRKVAGLFHTIHNRL